LPGLAYLIIDEPITIQLGVITIYEFATIQFEDTMDHELNCTHIFLHGGQLIAGPPVDGVDHIFQHKITINLLGDTSSEDFPLPAGPVMGAKSIGVFGRLSLISNETATTWTKLTATAAAGSSTLVVLDPVDWAVGSTILVTTSSYRAHEAERVSVQSISADGLTITIDESLAFSHTFTTALYDGKTVIMAAEVGLLSRRIKIVGAPFDGKEDDFSLMALQVPF
jgi:hypothetical protein